jgi:hypothetical protein
MWPITCLFLCLSVCPSVFVSVSLWVPPLIYCKGLMRLLCCFSVSPTLPLIGNGQLMCHRFSLSLPYSVWSVSDQGGIWYMIVTIWIPVYGYNMYTVTKRIHKEHIRWPSMNIREAIPDTTSPIVASMYSALHRNGSHPNVARVFVVAHCCIT